MDVKEKIKDINIESFIWIIYIFIIFFNIYSNELEKLFVINNDANLKIRFKKINKTVLSIIVIIYCYFLFVSYRDYKRKSDLFNELILIAAILFLVGGIITLYVVSNGDLDDELPIF